MTEATDMNEQNNPNQVNATAVLRRLYEASQTREENTRRITETLQRYHDQMRDLRSRLSSLTRDHEALKADKARVDRTNAELSKDVRRLEEEFAAMANAVEVAHRNFMSSDNAIMDAVINIGNEVGRERAPGVLASSLKADLPSPSVSGAAPRPASAAFSSARGPGACGKAKAEAPRQPEPQKPVTGKPAEGKAAGQAAPAVGTAPSAPAAFPADGGKGGLEAENELSIQLDRLNSMLEEELPGAAAAE